MSSTMRAAAGNIVFWSINNTTTTISGGWSGTGMIQSVDFNEESDEKVIKGSDGATKAVIFSDPRQTCTIEIIPSGSTETAAKSSSVLPDVGSSITITDSAGDDNELASENWIFISGSKRRGVDSECVLTFNLRKYSDALALVGS